MRIIGCVVILVAVAVGASILFVWFGAFNVAATEQHSELTLWLISLVRDRSIAIRATASLPAPSLTDPQLIKTGFRSYHTMCVVCHSAPGRKASPTRKGLNPKPPRLYAQQVQKRSNAELYWIIEHGIRMTGMPAFGPTHRPEAIWSLIAFIRRLPTLSSEQYQAMVNAAGLPDEMADVDEDENHQH